MRLGTSNQSALYRYSIANTILKKLRSAPDFDSSACLKNWTPKYDIFRGCGPWHDFHYLWIGTEKGNSSIWTQIVRVEGKTADHKTTTTSLTVSPLFQKPLLHHPETGNNPRKLAHDEPRQEAWDPSSDGTSVPLQPVPDRQVLPASFSWHSASHEVRFPTRFPS